MVALDSGPVLVNVRNFLYLALRTSVNKCLHNYSMIIKNKESVKKMIIDVAK